MMKRKLLTLIPALGVAMIALNAQAISIGFTESPELLLGTIEPSTPSNPATEVGSINYLLTQTSDGTGVVDGHNNSGVLTVANNPDDGGTETYTLYSGVSIPDPAPLAVLAGAVKDEDNPPDNTFTLLSAYDWLVAKYGTDSEVYYIGHLAAGTEIELASTTTRVDSGGGLSHISLYNPTTVSVADGGMTLLLLGVALGLVDRVRRVAR